MNNLTEADIAKNNFLARMSHEMRTPLNAIIGMCTIAQSSPEQEKISSCLEKINEASLHLLRMINEILDLAKLETDNLRLINDEFNLRRMITRNIEMAKFSLNAKGQSITLEMDPELPEIISSDEQMLTHVLSSLLSNAVKFTPPSGSIILTVKMAEITDDICKVEICVSDTGIGISPEARKNIFTLFEQAEGGLAREYGGAGLGLTISFKIVQLMGGEFQVESEPGKGSSFSFTIPVELSEADRKAHAPQAGPKDGPRYEGFNIVLAEDVEINREIIIMLLENTGVNIDCAENGQFALDLVKESPEKYSAIIMDIHMPVMDGYEASRKIRDFEQEYHKGNDYKRIPIIAITANVFQADVEKSIEAGMDSHLGKPVDIDELMAELDKYLLNISPP